MREVIKTVFLNYAFCSVLGGFVEYLTPGKMKRTVRICTILVILVICFVPLSGMDFNINTPNINFSNQENSYNVLMHTANLMEKEVYANIKNTLINLNIEEYEIYVSTEIDEESNTVYFEEIRVEVHKQYENLLSEIENSIPKDYKDILKVGVKNE